MTCPTVVEMKQSGKSLRICIVTGMYHGMFDTSETKVKFVREILKYYRIGLRKIHKEYRFCRNYLFAIRLRYCLFKIDSINLAMNNAYLELEKFKKLLSSDYMEIQKELGLKSMWINDIVQKMNNDEKYHQ